MSEVAVPLAEFVFASAPAISLHRSPMPSGPVVVEPVTFGSAGVALSVPGAIVPVPVPVPVPAPGSLVPDPVPVDCAIAEVARAMLSTVAERIFFMIGLHSSCLADCDDYPTSVFWSCSTRQKL
ncbi:hypothetical protein EOA85_05040 [Mesorhizobium sp. M5C.F.Ca.IN.020.29.1.1]|nr:hypothetical protein EOA85_05040 [Mesorhizobium sp. M5C.F.Ca.IN.020.29.1.1]TIM81346.1 MAG: hypothetical protein E5Y50_33775 [Mesorhizobium sp.]